MLLVFLVALLSAAAILLMAMPFVLVHRARQQDDARAPQLVADLVADLAPEGHAPG